jgi:hypothetical protein
VLKIALSYIMILDDENYAFFVMLLKNKTYALRWTNLQSKRCNIGQKKKSVPGPAKKRPGLKTAAKTNIIKM